MGELLPTTKKCKSCGEYKTPADFYRNRKGLHTSCKVCYIEINAGYQAKYRGKNRFAIRVRSCKSRAKEKGLPFDITEDYVKSIWTGTCPVFGTTLDINSKKGHKGHAQLDRVIPNKGYTKGNVVWLSERANRIKDDATLEDLERIVEWLKLL